MKAIPQNAHRALATMFCARHGIRGDADILENERKIQKILRTLKEWDEQGVINPHWNVRQAKKNLTHALYAELEPKYGSIIITILISIGISLTVKLIWAVIEWWWNRQDET